MANWQDDRIESHENRKKGNVASQIGTITVRRYIPPKFVEVCCDHLKTVFGRCFMRFQWEIDAVVGTRLHSMHTKMY
jgi:hypothetical protein